jgi:hypothetical protein
MSTINNAKKIFLRFKYIGAVFITLVSLFAPLNAHATATYDESFFSKNDILFYDPTDTTCSSTGGSPTQLSGSDNRQKIWNYLTGRGLSPEQTAGIMGNIATESGNTFSPTINEFGIPFVDEPSGKYTNADGGYGILQWTGGRRDEVVQALKTASPDLMTKYYTAAYSSSGSYTDKAQGFVSKNTNTGELMPVADNDALLLDELNFLVDSSMARSLHQPAIDKGYGTASDKEWDVLKKQKTIADASNVWVYSVEIPADIDTTAAARVVNGQGIYDLYSGSTAGATCSGGSKQQLAQQIVSSGNLTYDSGMPAAERTLLPNIASGGNNGNDWPCGMNMNILEGIAAITKDHKLRVNSLNRACSNDVPQGSSELSRHYAGNGSAVDFGPIDGVSAYSAAGANMILKYMGPFLVNNSGIGQAVGSSDSNTSGYCLPSSVLTNMPSGVQINRFGDYCTHLHMDVPPDVDPNLKCKAGINYGGCDKANQI